MFQPAIYPKKINLENGTDIEYKLFAMGKYKGDLKQSIIQLKYKGRKDLAPVFAERIYEYVSNNPEAFPLFNLSAYVKTYDCLIPVPPRPSSLLKRYDHLLLLGECLFK